MPCHAMLWARFVACMQHPDLSITQPSTLAHSTSLVNDRRSNFISGWVRDQVRFGVHPPLGPRYWSSVLKVLGDSPLPQVHRDPCSYISLVMGQAGGQGGMRQAGGQGPGRTMGQGII